MSVTEHLIIPLRYREKKGFRKRTLSESGWSILLSAITVGNFSSIKETTTFEMVSFDHSSSGSFIFIRSRHLATIFDVLPYPENCVCRVSTAVDSITKSGY